MKKQSKLLVTVLLILCIAATGWANEIEELERGAAAGDPEAMYELSMVYFEENEEQPDLDRIYPLLLKAAEKGHGEAGVAIFALAAVTGQPIPLSEKEQETMLVRFLRDGDEFVRRSFADIFMGVVGVGLPLNSERGVLIYLEDAEKAYHQYSPEKADFILSRLQVAYGMNFYEEGKIDLYEKALVALEKLLPSASKELQPLIKKYLVEDILTLADGYLEGEESFNVPADRKKARQWLEKAASLGSTSAQQDLADMWK